MPKKKDLVSNHYASIEQQSHFFGGVVVQHFVQEAVLAIDSTMMEAFQFQEILGSLVSQGLPTHNGMLRYHQWVVGSIFVYFLFVHSNFCGLEAQPILFRRFLFRSKSHPTGIALIKNAIKDLE